MDKTFWTQYLPHYEFGYEQAEGRRVNHFLQVMVANHHLGGFQGQIQGAKFQGPPLPVLEFSLQYWAIVLGRGFSKLFTAVFQRLTTILQYFF